MVIKRRELIFFAKFFAIFFVLEFFIVSSDFVGLQTFIAEQIASILELYSEGNLIFVEKGVFEIVSSCTGMVSGSILAAAVFSLKKPELGEKIIVFAAGFAVLLVLNFFRVLFVVWIGKEFGLEVSRWFHIISWFFTTFFVLGIWYFLTKKITKEKGFEGFL